MCLELAKEFLKNATECLRRAEEANTIEAQIHWLSMAQFWRNLAQQTTEEDMIAQSGSVVSDKGKSDGEENGNGDSGKEH
jgi:hypothetical protein